jgi:hypothetical protein
LTTLDFRFGSARFDELATEVLLGSQRVVGLAVEREVVSHRFAALCMGEPMVQLEKPSFATALPALVHLGALGAIAISHFAPDRS